MFEYYPYMPGPLLPDGASPVAITSDPGGAARAPMGDAIVGDGGLALQHLVELVGDSDRRGPQRSRPPATRPAGDSRRFGPQPPTGSE